MAKQIYKALRARWDDDRVARLRALLPMDPYPPTWPKVVFALPRGKFETIAHGSREYLDLRGFPLSIVFNLHDAGIDFSGAKSPKNDCDVDTGIRLDAVMLSDCLFDDVQTLQSVYGSYRNCSFRRARMREANVTAAFEGCVFDETNLRAARFYGSTFKNCSFRGADLLHGQMGGLTFERCDFREARFGRGAILGTKFLGCNLAGVDLADAMRDEETLFDSNCNLDGLRYAISFKFFGETMDVGPAPVKRPSGS